MFSRIFRARVQYALASRLNEVAGGDVVRRLPIYWSGNLASQYQVFLRSCRKAGVGAGDTAAVVAAWIAEVATINDDAAMADACFSFARATVRDILAEKKPSRGPTAKLITEVILKATEARSERGLSQI